MLKKIIISIMLFSYIFNITNTGYSANQNTKLALTSNLEYLKILGALYKTNIRDLQTIRKIAPDKYEQFISENYTKNYQPTLKKNWDSLSQKQKKFFFYVGVNLTLFSKIRMLSFSTIDYLAEFVQNYGDQEIIQDNFEIMLSLIPSDTNFWGSLFSDDNSLLYVKFLEKFLLSFGIIKAKHEQKINNSSYKDSSDSVKTAVDKFLGLLLKNRLKIKDEKSAKKIIENFSKKNVFFLRNQLFLSPEVWDTQTVIFLGNNCPEILMEYTLFELTQNADTISDLAIEQNDLEASETILKTENEFLEKLNSSEKATQFGLIRGVYNEDLHLAILSQLTRKRHLAFIKALETKNIRILNLLLKYQAQIEKKVRDYYSERKKLLGRNSHTEIADIEKTKPSKQKKSAQYFNQIAGRSNLYIPETGDNELPVYEYFQREIELLLAHQKIAIEVIKTADSALINYKYEDGNTIAYSLMQIAIKRNNLPLVTAILDNPKLDILTKNKQNESLLDLIYKKISLKQYPALATKTNLAVIRNNITKENIKQKIKSPSDEKINKIIEILEFLINSQINITSALIPKLDALIFNSAENNNLIDIKKLQQIRTMGV
jgi:hypothetical protein